MKLTNKLDFNLTLKRFKMMGASTSLFRSFTLIIAVIPLLGFLAVASCLDVFNGHPMEIYTNDVTLTPLNENSGARGFYWITWLDSDGNPYSGEQTWLFRINDQIARKEYYENGKQTLVEIFNQDEELVFVGLSEFSEDEDGVRYLKHFQKIDSSAQFLAFDAIWDQNIHTVNEYSANGQLQYQFSFNTEINQYEGWATQFDEQGNIIKKELFENGNIVETIQ